MPAPRSFSRTVASALALTALLAPAAAASPAPEPGGNREFSTRDLEPTVTRTIDDGFDVGSAAAGAGGAAGLVLLTVAGTSAFLRRRHGIAGRHPAGAQARRG